MRGVASAQAEGVERFAFYERVKNLCDRRDGRAPAWGNFLLRKGVIGDALPVD